MKKINGKKLAEKVKDKITKEIYNLNGYRPNLAIVLVGDKSDSKLYVNLKEKQAKTVGIDTSIYKCPNTISEKDLLKTIEFLNNDDIIDGILIQLPLPKHINTKKIIEAINPAKDIDGFHSKNLKKLTKKTNNFKIIPPVYAVIIEMLKNIKFNLKDKQVCLVAKADIFENNLADMLKHYGAKVTMAKINDKKLKEKTSKADLLITAIGKPEYIKSNMVKENAVVIDIGINKINGKLKGDVDFINVKHKASYITPVPGGVGPMTIAMAFKNILGMYKERHKQ